MKRSGAVEPAFDDHIHTISERSTVIVASAIVAHSGWHWMTERLSILSQYSFTWPALDAVFVVGLMRALLLLAIAGLVAWALSGVLEKLAALPPEPVVFGDAEL